MRSLLVYSIAVPLSTNHHDARKSILYGFVVCAQIYLMCTQPCRRLFEVHSLTLDACTEALQTPIHDRFEDSFGLKELDHGLIGL